MSLPDRTIVARTLAETLKARMDKPFTPPRKWSGTEAEREAWLVGYRMGLGQARVEIAMQVADEMREEAPDVAA